MFRTFAYMSTELTIRTTAEGKREVFDPIRKKYVALTPEEYVRQQTLLYLTNQKGYPVGLIAVETSLKLNELTKRTDILIHGRQRNPLMIVECKAESVPISQATFDQLARYNMTLNVPYLVATNGHTCYCCLIDFERQNYVFLKEIPHYGELVDFYRME